MIDEGENKVDDVEPYESEYEEIKTACKTFKKLSNNSYNLETDDLSRYWALWETILEWSESRDKIKSLREYFSKKCPVVEEMKEDLEIKMICGRCNKRFVEGSKWNCKYPEIVDGKIFRHIGKFGQMVDRKYARRYVSYIQESIRNLQDDRITPPEFE